MTIILYNLDKNRDELKNIISAKYKLLTFDYFWEISSHIGKNKIEDIIVFTNLSSINIFKKVLPRQTQYILVDEKEKYLKAVEDGFLDKIQEQNCPIEILEKIEKAQFHLMYQKNNQPNILETEEENIYDPETNLYNRSFMDQYFQLQKNHPKKSFVVLFHFEGLKIVHSLYGKDTRKKVLKEIINEIKKEFPSFILSRYYEYEIIGTNIHEVTIDLEKFIDKLNDRISIKHAQLPINATLGYEICDLSTAKIEEVIKRSRQMAIENKRKTLENKKTDYLTQLKETLAETNYESKHHLINLQTLANDYSNALGLDFKVRQSLLDAVALHDIGKLAVPQEILEKPTKLTKEEFEIIKKHPEYGYHICLTEGFSPEVLSAILHHHERFDGTGYPKGLKGEKIPFLARIITILDSYEVMTRGRVYKKAMSKQEAIDELIRCKETQFDPKLVDQFISLIN